MLKYLSLIILPVVIVAAILYIKIAPQTKFEKKVLLISIDGFRPEFYLDPQYDMMPTLQKLKTSGAYAGSVEPVFPTLTYPNHTSLLTGFRPEHHGVYSNTIFKETSGPTQAWYWESDKILKPTLNKYVQNAGGITASMGWPVTLGAKDVNYLIPEIFHLDGYYEGDNFEVKVRFTDSRLMTGVLNVTTLKRYENEIQFDFWTAEASAYILKNKNPDFMTIHFVDVDHVTHEFGPQADEVKKSLNRIDDNLKIVLNAVDLKTTCVIITGDHGFRHITKKVSPNALFIQKGWIKLDEKKQLLSWDVVAHASGAQAAIYVKNKNLLPEVEALLKANEANGFVLISKSQLQQLGAYPDADFAIEGAANFTVSGSYSDPLVVSSGKSRGQHGYLPTHKELHTGLIMTGCERGYGKKWETVHITDIPATIADILNLDTQKLDGKSLN